MSSHDSQHRPQYHFSPPANWLNDPNGFVYYQGEYHLFYQHNPGGSLPNFRQMHWGHAVSRDLVSWQHLPVALCPDEHGSIYSGSAVVDWKGTAGFGQEALVAVFTSHKEGYEAQSLAYSTDRGRTWTKYAGNPVVLPPDGLADFRDPKVFWYDQTGAGHWVMVLAAGDAVRFYRSPDLIHWEPSSCFGSEHGSHVGVWETPDLFELPVGEGPETRWVLTVGVGDGGPAGKSGMQYFIGQFDGDTFVSENPEHVILWTDYGADYYAAQSWSDEPQGRRVMAGWLTNWQYATRVPTSTWRGVFSLPRELSLKQTKNGVRLYHRPIPELSALRGRHHHWQNTTITSGTNLLEGITSDLVEIVAEFQLNPAVHSFGFEVRVGKEEQTTIGYNVLQHQVFVDRSNSGRSSFDEGFAGIHTANLEPEAGMIRLQIFVDRASVEVFGNDGLVVLSDSIFPDGSSLRLELFTKGSEIGLKALDVYELLPASFTVLD